ncbi:sterol carrier family protein [Naasia lichenicola]|uniref:Bacterial SCP orthologue domain-containing protein n=1 Tax=Naasia lichenicola TaxID=2565933 RepID=A0A4S4FGY3_9MICO|nr:sterol carrier family protein [Naasia lichenicola]THG29550.1 hypothetical protein E6C64_12745 [Naasia lichenicola]
MARARISAEVGVPAFRAALAAVSVDSGGVDGSDRPAADRTTMATAVRYSLQRLAERAEGNTVEVRVPPYGAVQCIPGPRHTRGTPPNVVEMDPTTWIELASGRLAWSQAMEAARVHASGTRADLSAELPIRDLAGAGS